MSHNVHSKDGLAVGTYVELVGLQAQPHVNGQLGVLLSFHEGAERWQVLLSGKRLRNVRPGNLRPAQSYDGNHPSPRAIEIDAEIQFNHRLKVLANQAEPFLITVPPVADLLAQPFKILTAQGALHNGENFHAGALVEAVGLRNASRLNGLEGTLMGFDEIQDCWKVLMSDGSGCRRELGSVVC